MIKVLISAYSCIPGRGSEPGNGWNWANYLSQQDLDVYLITTSRGKVEIEEAIIKLNISNIHVYYIDHSKFWGKAYYWNFVTMYIAYFLWQRKILKTALELHKIHKFKVVHHVTWASVKLGSTLYKLNNTKLIFGPVGGGHKASSKFKKYFLNEWKKESFRNFLGDYISFLNPLTKRTLKNAHYVLVANEETQIYAKANGAENPILFLDSALPSNYSDSNIDKSYKVKDKLQILWVGRMYAFKGMGLIIDSLLKLKEEEKNLFHLNVVGDGPFFKQLRSMVKSHGLEKLITLHGHVPYDEVNNFYRTSDIFLFCSLRDSFGSQILEAMSFGLPVITLNINGVKTFIPDDCAIKIDANEPEITVTKLSMAISNLLVNKNLRDTLSRKSYDFAKKQTWDKKVQYVIEHFYNC